MEIRYKKSVCLESKIISGHLSGKQNNAKKEIPSTSINTG